MSLEGKIKEEFTDLCPGCEQQSTFRYLQQANQKNFNFIEDEGSALYQCSNDICKKTFTKLEIQHYSGSVSKMEYEDPNQSLLKLEEKRD